MILPFLPFLYIVYTVLMILLLAPIALVLVVVLCVFVCVRRTKPGIFEEPEADSPDQLVKMLLTEGQNAALPAGKINR